MNSSLKLKAVIQNLPVKLRAPINNLHRKGLDIEGVMATLIHKYQWTFAVCVVALLLTVACNSIPQSPNPLEPLLLNGRPTIAEFGRGTCEPCKEMKPILDELAVEYKDRVNVVIINVDDYRSLVSKYGVMAIPTQLVFDSSGNLIARHMGVWPRDSIVAQFQSMGVS
jgi:thioredoxin 1